MQIYKDILSPMIDCFGISYYKVTFWNKPQGYGLKASDYNANKKCSGRVFSHWKNHMLERKWIRAPRTKRNKNKKTTTRATNNLRYAISPLGICHYSSIINEISRQDINKIIEILISYSIYVTFQSWKEVCDIISEKVAYQTLKDICDSIDLVEIDDEFRVVLNYKSRGIIRYERSRYIIRQNQVYVKLPEDMQTIESFHNPKPVSMPKIDDDLLYSDIAEFIIESFCYSVIENYYWKIFHKSNMLNWEDISSKKKTEIKKDIETYKKTLDQIPFEVYSNANNFIGQNLFGSIKQEQKLLKKISDTFYSEIAPKNGFRFIDTKGNTMQLFPD
jgi:hypothetical protein